MMAYVPQEPDLGNDTLAAWFRPPFAYRANAGLKDRLGLIPRWMDLLSLPRELLSKSAADLSGGEKQRAAVIGAILLRRPILLLDEPTSALDEKNVRRVLDGLFSLEDTTILAVSHDPALLDRSDRVIELTGAGGGHAD